MRSAPPTSRTAEPFARRPGPKRVGLGLGSRKSPASRRNRARMRTSSTVSSSPSPGSANTSALSAFVARSTSSRPAGVRATSAARPSAGCGSRTTNPSRASRSTVFVTLVGCTCSRAIALAIGIRPSRVKASRRSISNRAKERPKGFSALSMRASMSCWARMTEVTADIPAAASAQPCAAHWRFASAIGSTGSGPRRAMRDPLSSHNGSRSAGRSPGERAAAMRNRLEGQRSEPHEDHRPGQRGSDTYGDRKLNLETGLADRAASETVLDEIGERALEVALSHADKNAGTEVVVLSMAPEGSAGDRAQGTRDGRRVSAVHVVDEALAGADLGLTAAGARRRDRAHRLRPRDHRQPVDRRLRAA